MADGGSQGNGKRAREGLVRAWLGAHGADFAAGRWAEVARDYRQVMGLALVRKPSRAAKAPQVETAPASPGKAPALLPEIGWASLFHQRVRYFADGVAIGSRAFVEEVFTRGRERFGPRRRDGARRMRAVEPQRQAYCGVCGICACR